MDYRRVPSTSQSPYGTMDIPTKSEKDRKYIGFTIFKVLETVSSLYCSYFIHKFFIHGDTLSVIYISWPMFCIIDIVIILDRLFNCQREDQVLVFEIAASLIGCITHVLCAISLMYHLNLEKEMNYDALGVVVDPKFERYIKPAVASTVVSCLYLMDCLLSADAMLESWGIQMWSWPAVPNLQVDLPPSAPLQLLLPWETQLGREAVFTKFCKIRQSKKSMEKNTSDQRKLY